MSQRREEHHIKRLERQQDPVAIADINEAH